MLEKFKKSLEQATVVDRNGYFYFQHPITDGAPAIDPGIIEEICSAIRKTADTNADLILTIESMGIHIATRLSSLMSVPFNIVRKTPRYLPGEVVLDQRTGYSKGQLYLNVERGKKVLVVDAVVSTGGTLIAVLGGLKQRNCEISDVVCAIGRDHGKEAVERATGYKVKTLVDIEVGKDGVKII
jgi:adenine phosphoribosyltransferase